MFSNRADSITRTSSLRGTGSGTEIEIGKAFAARLLSKIRALPENRRGLIPADGFYEWRTIGGMKIPFSIGMKDDSPFVFAPAFGKDGKIQRQTSGGHRRICSKTHSKL